MIAVGITGHGKIIHQEWENGEYHPQHVRVDVHKNNVEGYNGKYMVYWRYGNYGRPVGPDLTNDYMTAVNEIIKKHSKGLDTSPVCEYCNGEKKDCFNCG